MAAKGDVDVFAKLRPRRIETTQLNARVDRALMRRLRVLAIEQDVHVQAIVGEAIRRLLADVSAESRAV